MAEEFLSDSTGSGCPDSQSSEPEREPVRVLIISSHEGVNEMIQNFYAMGFASVDAWSRPQPARDFPGEVVTIFTRYRQRQRRSRQSEG